MPTPAPDGPRPEDAQHLDWLAYGHYAMAALMFVCGFFPMIHLTVGIGLLTGDLGGDAPQEDMVGGMFVLVALAIIGMFWGISAGTIYAGRCLRNRSKHTFVFVFAIVQTALFQPLGAVLGILTIIVLMRPSVKARFAAAPDSSAPTSF